MYLKQIKILQVFILLIFVSCGNNNPKGFFVAPENSKKISIKSIELDSIILNIETSYSGIFKIHKDKMYFADKRSCLVYEFDKNGKKLNKNLGIGGGPRELNTSQILFFEPLNEGGYFIMGPSLDCHFYNNNWDRKKTTILNSGLTLKNKGSLKQRTNIKANEKWVYNPCYRNLAIREFDGFIFYNIYGEHPNFNPITTPDEYYDNGRIISKLQLDNSTVVDILGRMSPYYKKNRFYPQFSMTFFDVSQQGEFYVGYEADSTIYKYDKNYKILSAFGWEGEKMNLNYKELSTIKKVRRDFRLQRNNCGYYSWIEFIDERDLLFRSYKKGIEEITDGLQIYKNGSLIADLSVPKGFKVVGYIKPYFYSDVIIDDENETLKVYKFKI